MIKVLMLLVLLAPVTAAAQQLTASDSALILQVLIAEDQRDSSAPALTRATHHPDPRVRTLASRAMGRITDSMFASRTALPAVSAPPAWPEPQWRLRYRALAPRTVGCDVIAAALSDSAWPVRLRAADVVTARCNTPVIINTLQGWIDSLPADATRRSDGSVSWHAAAHALVGLARAEPAIATDHVARLAQHPEWHLRVYAARAASLLGDTTMLRQQARDSNANVREAAISALAGKTGHASDPLYLSALGDAAPQVVRAAATALKGSSDPGVRPAADAAFAKWVTRASASERDVRHALLALAGRAISEDQPPQSQTAVPGNAVGLALGDTIKLRIAMSPASGGGNFVVRMRGDVAPITAARIVEVASSGGYNGLAWHRVEPDFVIQGGSIADNEYVGSASYFRDELGNLPHSRGTVGMSTRGHDTGDGQWFVNLRDNLRLGQQYTVFAEVIEGIEVVDGILEGDRIESITRIK
jgi:cyclophilin family peptidyl-prolyl cis-trans isomerase